MSRSLIALAAATVLAAGFSLAPAAAQQAAPAQPAAPAAPELPNPEPDHLAAAVDFLNASGATKGFDAMIPQIGRARLAYVAQRPELETMINDAALKIVPEVVATRSTLNQNLAKLYTKYFSKEELQQIAAFYHTEVGQKLAANQVKILQESVPVVQKWNQDLDALVMKKIKDEVAASGGQL